jgi:hypothetical protein
MVFAGARNVRLEKVRYDSKKRKRKGKTKKRKENKKEKAPTIFQTEALLKDTELSS